MREKEGERSLRWKKDVKRKNLVDVQRGQE